MEKVSSCCGEKILKGSKCSHCSNPCEEDEVFNEDVCEDCLDMGIIVIAERDEHGAIVGGIEKKCHCQVDDEGWDNNR